MFLQHYMTGGTPKVPLQFNQWLDLKKKKKKGLHCDLSVYSYPGLTL